MTALRLAFGGSDPRSRAQAGFSLLETLVAIMLLSVVALSVAPMLMMGVATSAVSQEATELTVAASDQLEFLASLPFGDAQLAAGGSIASSAAGYSVDPFQGDPNLYLRWQIADETAILKRIQLVAGNRNSVFGPTREVQIETFRTDLR